MGGRRRGILFPSRKSLKKEKNPKLDRTPTIISHRSSKIATTSTSESTKSRRHSQKVRGKHKKPRLRFEAKVSTFSETGECSSNKSSKVNQNEGKEGPGISIEFRNAYRVHVSAQDGIKIGRVMLQKSDNKGSSPQVKQILRYAKGAMSSRKITKEQETSTLPMIVAAPRRVQPNHASGVESAGVQSEGKPLPNLLKSRSIRFPEDLELSGSRFQSANETNGNSPTKRQNYSTSTVTLGRSKQGGTKQAANRTKNHTRNKEKGVPHFESSRYQGQFPELIHTSSSGRVISPW